MFRKTFLVFSLLSLSLLSLFIFKTPTASAKEYNPSTTGQFNTVGPGITQCDNNTYVAVARPAFSSGPDPIGPIHAQSVTPYDIFAEKYDMSLTAVTSYPLVYETAIDITATCYNSTAYIAFVEATTSHVFVCSLDAASNNSSCIDTGKTSTGKPGLVVANNRLYLAWAATDLHLSFIQSQDGVTWTNPIETTDYTVAGEGVGVTSDGTTIYIAWVSATGTPYLHLGTYNGTTVLGLRLIFTDYTQSAPAISYTTPNGVEFLFRGGNNNHLYTSTYKAGVYSGNTPWSETAIFSPALSGIESAYISDAAGSPLIIDDGKFFYYPETPN